jgi:hypothetical protein
MSEKRMSGIEPTLFIGLGGAGGNVLGRLRSLFAMEFGPMGERESPVQFLLLDADDFQKLNPMVRETLNEQDEFLSLSHFNPRHYIDEHRRDHRSDLHRWFDWDARPLLADEFVRDGASRLRLLGRLCLHRAYYEVEKIVSEKILRAKSARAYVTAGEPIRKSERPFRVVIVGSTCGGTGSGIFLDMVHMVNQLVRSTGATPDVTAFLLLPFWFIEKNRAVDTDLVPYYRANAWAFFEELNHVLLRPSRLAELALAPNRAAGVEPDLAYADYEPLKAVYLMDSEIPNVGSFGDPNDWHTYVSRGIFQLYLTPEEGSLDSVFSNVKTKLGETDGRYGLRKRFASLGYADLRHPGPQLREWLLERSAVEFVGERLLADPDEARVAAAAEELRSVLEQEVISAELNRLDRGEWPKLDPADFQRKLGKEVEANLTSLGALGQQVQNRIDQFNRKLPSQADLDAAVARARSLLQERATRLTLGLKGEREVLERVHAALWEGLDPGEEAEGLEPLEFTTDVRKLKGVQEAEAEATKTGFFSKPGKSPGAYTRHLTDVNNALDAHLSTWHEKEGRVRRRYLVQRIAGKLNDGRWLDWTASGEQAGPSVMGRVRDQLLTAASVLGRVQPSSLRLAHIQKRASLTSQFSPTLGSPDQVWNRYRERYARECQDGPRIDALMAMIAADLPALDAGGLAHDRALDLLMGKVRDHFGRAFDQSYNLLADMEAAQDLGAVRQLQNLYGLSAPCCRIDGSKLTLGDTTPRVLVAAGNARQQQVSALLRLASREHVPQTEWAFSDRDASAPAAAGDDQATGALVQALLQLPSPPGLMENDGSRFGLLQAVYAFPSYAIAGMNTLRTAYEQRDRKRSFPHIHREWNQNNLRVSRQGELTDGELLQFGRVRALSDFFSGTPVSPASGSNGRNGNGSGPAGTIPVHQLRFDSDGAYTQDGPWLLKYQKGSDGRMHLLARSADPVPNHVRVWRLAGDPEDLREVDLDQNIRSYIASSAHLSHVRLLSTDVEELENGPGAGDIAKAYHAYVKHLEGIAGEFDTRQRQTDAQLHRRVASALRRYAEGLVVADVPVP